MDPPQNQINSSLAKGIPSKKGKTENVLAILYPVQRQTQAIFFNSGQEVCNAMQKS